jgi:cytochrome b pre-mRNA-processing protein 3
MFARLFKTAKRPNEVIVDRLYGQIVAAARQPVLYAQWEVPDTPLGRYEMIALHMFLFLHRVRGGDARLSELAQELTDEFFKDVDHSLRELGIGDVGVPKRMKKLAKMFYGRAEAYGSALDAGDKAALSAALARNVRPQDADWAHSSPLAGYVVEAAALLSQTSDDDLLKGAAVFPSAQALEPQP